MILDVCEKYFKNAVKRDEKLTAIILLIILILILFIEPLYKNLITTVFKTADYIKEFYK